jgi:hypothetical protein
MTKIKSKLLVPTLISSLLSLCTFIVFPASAGLHGSDIQQRDKVNNTKTERIEVLGTKSRITFRREMIKAEDNFYDLYNQLTTNSDFQVKCEKVKQVGSHIKLRECTPNFVQTIRANIVAGDFAEMSSVEYDQQAEFRIKDMQEKHRKSMATTISNNSKLKELFITFQHKKQELVNSVKL